MSDTSPGWLERASLADNETTWGDGSRLLGGLAATGRRIQAALQGWVAGSALARQSDRLAMGGVAAIFLVSPFVGTGINAIMVAIAFTLVLFRLLCAPASRASFTTLDATVLCFAAMHVVATGFSAFLVPSLKGLAKMMVYWMAYFAFRQTLQTRQARNLTIGALLLAGTLEALYGIYQWKIGVEPLAAWEDPETLNPLTRVYSTLMNPNLLAGYLMPIFPLALTAAGLWRGRARQLAVAAALTTPVCIWFTYCRSGFIALFATVLLFALMGLSLSRERLLASRKLLGGVAFAALAAVALIVVKVATNPALQERFGSIVTLRGHSSNSFRVNVWSGVLHMIQNNWLWGVGIGNTAFRKMYSLYMISGFEALGAYNIFLEVLAEMGIIGLVVFVWLLVSFLSRNLYTFWTGTGENRWWAVAVVAGLVGMGIMGMVDTVFYRPAIQLQFWLLLALTIALSPRKEAPTE